jgi:hypothetical protein
MADTYPGIGRSRQLERSRVSRPTRGRARRAGWRNAPVKGVYSIAEMPDTVAPGAAPASATRLRERHRSTTGGRSGDGPLQDVVAHVPVQAYPRARCDRANLAAPLCAVLSRLVVCVGTHVLSYTYYALPGGDMPTSSRQPSVKVCGNCEAPTRKLGRLVVRFNSGTQRTLLVCAFCHMQLAPHVRNRRTR